MVTGLDSSHFSGATRQVISSTIQTRKFAQEFERFVEFHDGSAALTAFAITLLEQHQFFIIGRLAQTMLRSVTDGSVENLVGLHVVLDQPGRSFRDGSLQRFECRADMVVGVEPLADIMQQRGEQELFVIRQLVSGQFKHLQAVVEDISLGMMLLGLTDLLQWQQQRTIDLEAVEFALGLDHFGIEIQVGVLGAPSR